MDYPIRIPGFEHLSLELRVSRFAGPSLLEHGRELPAGAKRGEYVLTRPDGSSETVALKPRFLNLDVPRVQVGSETIEVLEPLTTFQWIWCGLPIILVLRGGAIGALVGVSAMAVNTQLFRSQANAVTKYAASAGASVLAVVVYGVIAMAMTGVLSPSGSRTSPATVSPALSSAVASAPSPAPSKAPVRLTPEAFESRDGRFSVVFPSSPKGSDPTADRNGKKLQMHMWYAEQYSMAYGVGWWDEPESLAWFGGLDGFFDFTVRGSIEKMKGTPLGKYRRVTLDGVPGAAYEADMASPAGRVWGRVYLAGSRGYTMIVMANDRTRSKDAEAFFETFKILK